MHKGFMLLLTFLLFHEYLDAFPAYLADDNMLRCLDTDSAAVGFFCTNQFAVNGIELHLRAIAKTADGNNTALGSYYHTTHLCRTDVVGRIFFDIFEILPIISRLISCDVRNIKRTIRISIMIKRCVTSRRRIGIFTNYTCQTGATFKALVSQRCHGRRNINTCQTGAIFKAPGSQRCYGRGDINTCQSGAVFKATVSQPCHGRGDSYTCQTGAVGKAFVTKRGDRIFNTAIRNFLGYFYVPTITIRSSNKRGFLRNRIHTEFQAINCHILLIRVIHSYDLSKASVADKRIETIFSQLTDQFLVIRNYAKITNGLFARIKINIIKKVLCFFSLIFLFLIYK